MNTSLALLTDMYQLSMAYGYWRSGLAEREAVFHLTFRTPPFAGGYAVAAGLGVALDYLAGLRFSEEDCAYLATLTDVKGAPLFAADFLTYLAGLQFTCDVDAVAEGRLVFPHEPLLRVRGPLLQAQLVETALLCAMNFSTLIATKATRVCRAAAGAPVLEFGLRRAQGFDGALTASRAAYIGGVAATSNVLAGKQYGIPVKGTHAHSWVMVHPDEPSAFAAFAEAMPGNCTLLVDTYDTEVGVANAIAVGQALAARGQALLGVRLDSGDLAVLSQKARAMLDAAGLHATKIIASNDLDEAIIDSLRAQGACIDQFGVGTKLVTAYDQPALGGVYKLGALREHAGPAAPWRYAVKRSEQAIKVSNPGVLSAARQWAHGHMIGDVIFDAEQGCADASVSPLAEPTRVDAAARGTMVEPLLWPVLRAGQATPYAALATSLAAARARRERELAALAAPHLRTLHPQPYPVALDSVVAANKAALLAQKGPR